MQSYFVALAVFGFAVDAGGRFAARGLFVSPLLRLASWPIRAVPYVMVVGRCALSVGAGLGIFAGDFTLSPALFICVATLAWLPFSDTARYFYVMEQHKLIASGKTGSGGTLIEIICGLLESKNGMTMTLFALPNHGAGEGQQTPGILWIETDGAIAALRSDDLRVLMLRLAAMDELALGVPLLEMVGLRSNKDKIVASPAFFRDNVT